MAETELYKAAPADLTELKSKQDAPALAAGAYDNIQAEDYHRIFGLTKSGLMELRRSPAHFWNWMNGTPSESTTAMNIGTACHTLVFEPHKWNDEICVIPADAPKKPTKAQLEAKEPSDKATESINWWANFEATKKGRATITAEDEIMCRELAQAVRNNDEVRGYLDHPSAKAEVSIVSKERVKGLDIVCKGRIDLLTMDGTVMVDLKTCIDASPEGFGKSFMSMGYWMQAAHYLAIAKHSGMKVEKFIFIAAEKEPPYCTALYSLTADDLEKAWAIRKGLMERLSDCIARNNFPAYSKGVHELTLPSWIK